MIREFDGSSAGGAAFPGRERQHRGGAPRPGARDVRERAVSAEERRPEPEL